MFQMLGVFAEFEAAMIRERVRAGERRDSVIARSGWLKQKVALANSRPNSRLCAISRLLTNI